jgi:hypothetical protein
MSIEVLLSVLALEARNPHAGDCGDCDREHGTDANDSGLLSFPPPEFSFGMRLERVSIFCVEAKEWHKTPFLRCNMKNTSLYTSVAAFG